MIYSSLLGFNMAKSDFGGCVTPTWLGDEAEDAGNVSVESKVE